MKWLSPPGFYNDLLFFFVRSFFYFVPPPELRFFGTGKARKGQKGQKKERTG